MTEDKRIEQNDFFDRLYQARFSKMQRYAEGILSNPSLAVEVVQDAFFEVLLHIDELMQRDHPERWLQKTVKNKALHVLRSQARDSGRLISIKAEELSKMPAPDMMERVEEDEQAGLAELKQNISNALTEEEFYLLKRVAFDKLSYKELSEETGSSIWACQKRIQRIRAKLKKILGEN